MADPNRHTMLEEDSLQASGRNHNSVSANAASRNLDSADERSLLAGANEKRRAYERCR
jgi:hypothetical protein